MFREQRSHFTERNNQLVRQSGAGRGEEGEAGGLEGKFASLLSDVQSVPPQSMFCQVEMAVLSNLMAVEWLRDVEGGGDTTESAVRTLIRLLSTSDRELSEDTDYIVLMNLILHEKICWKLTPESYEDLLEIVSFLILRKTSDVKLVQNYCEWGEKMKACREEINIGIHCQRKLMKIIPHHNENVVSFSEVLRRMIQIKANLGQVESAESDLIPKILEAANYYKQRNRQKLSECLNRILENDLVERQSEMVTKFFLILKGNILVEENKFQSALATFGMVSSEDPDNIEAYIGIAKCFEKMGNSRNELDIWRIICKIQHLKTDEKCPEVGSFDLGAKLLRTFFPLEMKRRSFVSSLLKFARKCHHLGEYEDSADNYLDILALDFTQKCLEDKMTVQLEAVLALLLDGDHKENHVKKRREASLLLLQDILTRGRPAGRETDQDWTRTVVTYFMFGHLYTLTAEYDAALRSFNTSLQFCQIQEEQFSQNTSKKRKLENGTEDEMKDVSESLELVKRLKARLYAEKSEVYQLKGDKASSVFAIKSALRLDNSQVYLNKYSRCQHKLSRTSEDDKQKLGDSDRMIISKYNEDICISFMMTASTLGSFRNKNKTF